MAIRRRGAFTLVELLVVITIIGMLMALLLPAVNAAVEAGRNTQCKNNMRNMAMAVDTYQQNANGYYPGYDNTLGGNTVSWVVMIFPNIERLDLHKDWSDTTIALASKPKPYIDLLVCPSDPPEQIGGPILSYVANSGCGTSQTKPIANGLFHAIGTQSSVDSIVDGKTNTICLSENIQATKWADYGNSRNETSFVWHSTTSPTATQKINGNKTTTTTFDINSARPSSFHSGGVNVAFCDYHVIFLKEEVDYGVYAQLMTPNYRESDMQAGWKVPLDDAKYK